jgi:hypothetical protein
MDQPRRRVFMLQVIAGTSALLAAQARAEEETTEKVTEADPYARSMGFRVLTQNVDQAKYPRHTIEQHCSVCQLFSGKEGEPLGPCSFYGGRLVPINGWCRNFKARKPVA